MAYNSKIKSKQVDELFEAVLALENLDECYRFLKTSAPSKKSKP